MTPPKYSQFEHERRFVVMPARCPDLDQATAIRIDDLYLEASRLRLRRNTAIDGTTVFKLAKKYPSDKPMSRPMTNLYLDATEFELLGRLPGRRVFKRRFRIDDGFIVDVFDGVLAGLILGEIEADLAMVSAAAMPS